MSAVCPACGIAVVPGYVRCPKCHAGLPSGRSKRTTGDPGGTAVPQKGFPVVSAALVALGVAGAIFLVFGVVGGERRSTELAAALAPEPIEAVGLTPTPRPVPTRPAAPAPATRSQAPRDPRGALDELEDVLRQQRLWGRAELAGRRIDLRSGSCGDPAMRPAIDSKRIVLRGAGLTKLRCLEQSGAVVFERDL